MKNMDSVSCVAARTSPLAFPSTQGASKPPQVVTATTNHRNRMSPTCMSTIFAEDYRSQHDHSDKRVAKRMQQANDMEKRGVFDAFQCYVLKDMISRQDDDGSDSELNQAWVLHDAGDERGLIELVNREITHGTPDMELLLEDVSFSDVDFEVDGGLTDPTGTSVEYFGIDLSPKMSASSTMAPVCDKSEGKGFEPCQARPAVDFDLAVNGAQTTPAMASLPYKAHHPLQQQTFNQYMQGSTSSTSSLPTLNAGLYTVHETSKLPVNLPQHMRIPNHQAMPIPTPAMGLYHPMMATWNQHILAAGANQHFLWQFPNMPMAAMLGVSHPRLMSQQIQMPQHALLKQEKMTQFAFAAAPSSNVAAPKSTDAIEAPVKLAYPIGSMPEHVLMPPGQVNAQAWHMPKATLPFPFGNALSMNAQAPHFQPTSLTLQAPEIAGGNRGFVGAYSPNSRKRRIERFHEKRTKRNWDPKKRKTTGVYMGRQDLDTMVRVRGRFTKKVARVEQQADRKEERAVTLSLAGKTETEIKANKSKDMHLGMGMEKAGGSEVYWEKDADVEYSEEMDFSDTLLDLSPVEMDQEYEPMFSKCLGVWSEGDNGPSANHMRTLPAMSFDISL